MTATYEHESLNDLLAQWLKDYGLRILRTIRSRGVPPDDAEDVMQEVLVKAPNGFSTAKRGQYIPRAGSRKWPSMQRWITVGNKQQRPGVGQRLGDSGKVRHSGSARRSERPSCRSFWLCWTPTTRANSSLTVVRWRLFRGYTFAQIADRLGVSAVTASRWYQQELQQLRQALEGQGIESLPEQS